MNFKINKTPIVAIIFIILIIGSLFVALNMNSINNYFNKDVLDNNNNYQDNNNDNNQEDKNVNNTNSNNNNNNNTNQDNNNNNNGNSNNNNNNNNNTNSNNTNNNSNNGTLTIQFSLNGADEINIVVGSKWSDPGFEAVGSDGKNYKGNVIAKGRVKTNTVGDYTITYVLKVNNIRKTLTRKIHVKSKDVAVKSINCDKSSYTINVGESVKVIPKYTPSDATQTGVTYTSSKTSIATVDKNGKVVGKVKGEVTITITSTKNKKIKGTCKVTINEKKASSNSKDVAVNKIYLSLDSINTNLEYASVILNIGETINVKTVIDPSNATNKTLTWTSNKEKVAKVSNGKITAVASGTATITVKSNNGKTTTITVKVPKKTDVLISSDGTINNSYFGIVKNASTNKLAEQTSRGLTAAINYAGMHGIKNIKLSKGTYICKLVEYREFGRGSLQNGDYNQSCIHITQSNINFDLNGSTLELKSSNMPKSRLIYIGQATNVSVFNGTLKGDYKNHSCQKGGKWDIINKGGCPKDSSPSHESLHGILMQGVRNVKIRNLTIKEFVGDGITILNPECKKDMCYSSDKKYKYYKSEGVEISNNIIHTTGRNAISIIYGENITIKGNTFHDNKHGIDLEPNDIKELINKITITENTMYNVRKNTSIALHRAYNVIITKNKLSNVTGARYVEPTQANPSGGDRRGYKSINEIYSNVKLSGNKVYKAKENFLTDAFLNKHNICFVICYRPGNGGYWQNFDNKWYFVDSNTTQFYKNRKATISGHEYTFDNNGVCIKGYDC